MPRPIQYPALYSFRRCPYAMRARMAIDYSSASIEHREILLKEKPKSMLVASAKGTVPVLVIDEGTPQQVVIDESREIMMWAIQQHDPQHWYAGLAPQVQVKINQWIDTNDGEFKPWLDRYKYSVGYPEHSEQYYRTQCEVFLSALNNALEGSCFLLGAQECLADNAIFPFVRQFAFVDKDWFDRAPYPSLQRWLDAFLASKRFNRVMIKHPLWQPAQ